MDLVSPHLSIPERLTQIERVLGDIHGRLFGNGQPGELEQIKKDAGARNDKIWKAIEGLRQWRWQVTGALAAIVAIAEFVKGWLGK